jgi:hypothetical protein
MVLIIIVILVLVCVGGLPQFGFHSYGAYPSGVLGLVLIILVVLFLLGRL